MVARLTLDLEGRFRWPTGEGTARQANPALRGRVNSEPGSQPNSQRPGEPATTAPLPADTVTHTQDTAAGAARQ